MADVEKRLNSSLADLISESKGSTRGGKVSLMHSLLRSLCAVVTGNGAGCARCTSRTPERLLWSVWDSSGERRQH